MTMESDFRFYPVGHGLFYAGRIVRGDKNLTFVYDCGSQWDDRLLDAAITRNLSFMACSRQLDYLFISHLHYDHISGIHRLIERFPGGVRALIMPYVTFAEYVAGMAALKEDESDQDFMASLDELVKEKIEHLIVVGSGESDGEANETQVDVPEELGFRNLQTDNRLSEAFFGDYPWLDSVKQRIHVVKQGSRIERSDAPWRFQWYVHPLTEAERMKLHTKIMDIQEFRDCASSQGRKELLRKLFCGSGKGKENSIIDKLRKCYESLSIVKKGGHNATSLVLMHRPMKDYAVEYGEIRAGEILGARSGVSTVRRIPAGRRYVHPHTKNGTVLFGDINLASDSFASIVRYFKSEWQHIAIATVPHHGSIKNWNEAVFDYLRGVVWIASSRYEDVYHHPDGAVVYNIIRKAPIETFIWNHENNMVAIHWRHLGWPDF